jgi:hypothetical protein
MSIPLRKPGRNCVAYTLGAGAFPILRKALKKIRTLLGIPGNPVVTVDQDFVVAWLVFEIETLTSRAGGQWRRNSQR